MSLEYTVDLVTQEAPRAVQRFLEQAVAGVSGAAPQVRAASITYEPTRQMYVQSFGFEPTVTIVIPVDKRAAPGDAQDQYAVAALGALLARYDGGLYASYAGVQPVALRRGGEARPVVDAVWIKPRPWAHDVLPEYLVVGEVPEPE